MEHLKNALESAKEQPQALFYKAIVHAIALAGMYLYLFLWGYDPQEYPFEALEQALAVFLISLAAAGTFYGDDKDLQRTNGAELIKFGVMFLGFKIINAFFFGMLMILSIPLYLYLGQQYCASLAARGFKDETKAAPAVWRFIHSGIVCVAGFLIATKTLSAIDSTSLSLGSAVIFAGLVYSRSNAIAEAKGKST
jgi:hypothetical protein